MRVQGAPNGAPLVIKVLVTMGSGWQSFLKFKTPGHRHSVTLTLATEMVYHSLLSEVRPQRPNFAVEGVILCQQVL